MPVFQCTMKYADKASRSICMHTFINLSCKHADQYTCCTNSILRCSSALLPCYFAGFGSESSPSKPPFSNLPLLIHAHAALSASLLCPDTPALLCTLPIEWSTTFWQASYQQIGHSTQQTPSWQVYEQPLMMRKNDQSRLSTAAGRGRQGLPWLGPSPLPEPEALHGGLLRSGSANRAGPGQATGWCIL